MNCTPDSLMPLRLPMIKRLPANAHRPSGGVSGAWWIARWLLVLVLAFDLLSAPFHPHHHDGVEGQIEVAAAHAHAHAHAHGHASVDDGATHAEGEEHPLVSHAAMAIRIDPSRLGQIAAADGTDDRADAPVALVSVLQPLAAFDEPPPSRFRPDRSRPDFLSHRSLPPAGRAPPLHA